MEIIRRYLIYPFKKLYTFFLWSSGADLDILEHAPTDRNKFFGIGGTIVFTALMACFAGGYAFFTAFKDPVLSVFFGLFWGALIFNLDRYIVSTFGVGDGKKTISKQELIEAAPRLLMAIILGFVISTPLELKLFEREINAEIKRQNLITGQEQKTNAITTAKNQNQFYFSEIETLRKRMDARDNEEKLKKDKRDKAYDKYMCELNGTCGTGVPGEGPVFREAKENYLTLNKEYSSLVNENSEKRKQDNQIIKSYQDKIDQNLKSGIDKVAELDTANESRNGLLADLQALNNLCYNEIPIYKEKNGASVISHYEKERSVVWYAKWLITILFVFIEIAPILFKMMTERGVYDDILDRIKHEAKVKQLLLQSNINEEVNTSVKVHSERNKEKLNAEIEANKNLLKSIANAQAEIAQVAIDEWKKEQLVNAKNNYNKIVKSS